jgi:hypothetical protein
MSYTDFDIPKIEKDFGVKVKSRSLSWQIEFIEPSRWLIETLERGNANAFVSEKSRSEFLVAPVLLAVKEVTENQIQVFSGQTLNVDVNLGLTGECDFILSKTEPTPILREPIMAVVEAKKNDIELGLGQCIAQMIASKIFNSKKGNDFKEIFGCVTTGETWQFLKLEDNFATIDVNRFFISEVGQILGVFKSIANYYEG